VTREVMGDRTGRDPWRSLVIGAVIAGVTLAVILLVVLIGVYLVFAPRSSDRESWRVRPGTTVLVSSAPIHPVAPSDS
jgi:hypothetical protein